MPGKRVEQDLGKAEARALLGHDHVTGQQGLESAPERRALGQADGDYRQVVIDVIVVDHVDASRRIGMQRVPVAGNDGLREIGEIAAEVEYAPDGGSESRCSGRVRSRHRPSARGAEMPLEGLLHPRESAQAAPGYKVGRSLGIMWHQ